MKPGGGTPARALAAGVALALAATSGAHAGAWVQPKGKGQVIVKYEDMRADEAFDPDGARVPLAVDRTDQALAFFGEYGLTDRLTLQVKGDWQDGEDEFADYQGRGPLQAGVVWQAWRNDHGAFSLQGSYASAGDGRNAGYAEPGVGGDDWEARAAFGWSFSGQNSGQKPKSRWRAWLNPGRSFVEVQLARRVRGGLQDETRLDLTLGRHLNDDWMLLNQTYAGQTDNGGARWLQSESSIVRRFGSWNVQAGWRSSAAGREVPVSSGPVLALWKRF